MFQLTSICPYMYFCPDLQEHDLINYFQTFLGIKPYGGSTSGLVGVEVLRAGNL